MLIMFLPVAPILIAVCLLVLALCGEVAAVSSTLTTILWIVMVAVSVIILICNLMREATPSDKVISTVISIGANVLSLIVSSNYFAGLNEAATMSGLGGSIEFSFILLFGGLIWFGTIGACVQACLTILDEFEESRYLKAFGYIAVGLFLAMFFGLL